MWRSLGCATLLMTGMLASDGVRAEAQGTTSALVLTDVRVIGRSAAISYVVSSTMDAHGNVYVLDPDNRQVLKFSPNGDLLWRSGQRGGGPGEYQLPSRLAVGPNGRVYVFDIARQGLTVLDSTGTFLSQKRFRLPVRNPDRMIVLADGRIVLSGIAEFVHGAGHAVHVYSTDLEHERSFGEPPAVRDWEHARMWGVGGVTNGPDGTILFSRKIPYEISQFRPDGELVRRFQSSVRITHTPDDAFVTSRSGPKAVTTLGADVPRPLPAVAIGAEFFLTGLGLREGSTRHLYSMTRGFLGTVPLPAEWEGVIGYDAVRGYLWGYGESDLEPVLFRARARVRDL